MSLQLEKLIKIYSNILKNQNQKKQKNLQYKKYKMNQKKAFKLNKKFK